MKKFILPIIISLLTISCARVYFPTPQPDFAEELSLIPEKFQGKFQNNVNLFGDTDSGTYIVTENTIIVGEDTVINDKNNVFKSWGNYFFWNQKIDTSNYWICHIVYTNGLKGKYEKISYKYISSQFLWDQFNIQTTVKNDGNGDVYINDLNTLQFHHILRMTEDLEITRINRIK